MKMLQLLFAVALGATSAVALAQWQWVDKDGRKVFSDRAPPPEILDKDIQKRPAGRLPSGPATSAAVETPEGSAGTQPTAANTPKVPTVDKELEAKKKVAADAEAAKRNAETERIAKLKIENCARAKQAKATLDSGTRIGRVNAAGEREVMDEAARAAEAKRIQTIMASECQ